MFGILQDLRTKITTMRKVKNTATKNVNKNQNENEAKIYNGFVKN